jgi:hypothetical protein
MGLIALGMAMLRSPAFGVVLGMFGVVAASELLVGPLSSSALVGVLALLVLLLVLGWALYGLPGCPQGDLRS